LSRAFFARRAAGGLTGYALLLVPSTCSACHFRVGLARAWKRAISFSRRLLTQGSRCSGGIRIAANLVGISHWTILAQGDLLAVASIKATNPNLNTRPPGLGRHLASKLVDIANGVEAVQDGRIYIERVNAPFLAAGGSGEDFRAGMARDHRKGLALAARERHLRGSPIAVRRCLRERGRRWRSRCART
jgi:hypothetical protein